MKKNKAPTKHAARSSRNLQPSISLVLTADRVDTIVVTRIFTLPNSRSSHDTISSVPGVSRSSQEMKQEERERLLLVGIFASFFFVSGGYDDRLHFIRQSCP